MRWYQKAGLSFVFGSGALLCGAAFFAACAGRPLGMGLAVLAVGVAALFANASWLPGLLRRRAFRAVIGMRRAAAGTLAAVQAALAPVVVDPFVLRRSAVVAGLAVLFLVLGADQAWATGPWETAVTALCNSFDGVIGKGLALVAGDHRRSDVRFWRGWQQVRDRGPGFRGRNGVVGPGFPYLDRSDRDLLAMLAGARLCPLLGRAVGRSRLQRDPG